MRTLWRKKRILILWNKMIERHERNSAMSGYQSSRVILTISECLLAYLPPQQSSDDPGPCHIR